MDRSEWIGECGHRTVDTGHWTTEGGQWTGVEKEIGAIDTDRRHWNGK